MTKENKGLLSAVLIMIPALWLTAYAISKVSESDGALFSSIIIAFLLVNVALAWLCSEKRTTKNVAFLSVTYAFVSFSSTIVIAMVALFIALATGAIRFGKIGG